MTPYQFPEQTSTREDVFQSFNLGSQTFTAKFPISRFIDLSDVPNDTTVAPEEVAQRQLDKNHATNLATYILKGLVFTAANFRQSQGEDFTAHTEVLERMGSQLYFSIQPIVVNVPAALDELKPIPQENQAGDPLCLRISIPPTKVLWVIDGQHRRWAMNLVLEFLRHVRSQQEYPKRGSLYPFNGDGPKISVEHQAVWRDAMNFALNYCTVTVEAHLNLSVEAQRQLFHDLNNLGKKVSAGMAFDFDNSNPVNLFIKEVLIEEGVLGARVVEKDVVDWASHDGSMARKDLVAINSILFLNKTNPKGASPVQIGKMASTARRFWSTVSNIADFGKAQAKQKTVAAQPVVLKALAKLTYDFALGRSADSTNLDVLLDGIEKIDFSHANPMWRYYELTPQERANLTPGLTDYLPDEAEGNRDVGSYESGRMRFGAKHNDIYPILGDMIRWKLKLPNRNEAATMLKGISL